MHLLIKKRAYERLPLEMEVQFRQLDDMYPGTIKNISQNGMYIETSAPLPFQSNFDVHMPFKTKLQIYVSFNNTVLEIPVRVKRLVKNGADFTGMGVMLSNPCHNYMAFLSNLIPAN